MPPRWLESCRVDLKFSGIDGDEYFPPRTRHGNPVADSEPDSCRHAQRYSRVAAAADCGAYGSSKADIAETERRTAGGAEKAMAMVAQARAAEANVSRGGGGVSLQVGDISKLTDREAQGALAVAEKLQSLSGWRKMTATVSNNSETTLSLDALRTCCAKGSAWRAAIRRTPRPERSSIFPPRRSVSCRDGRSCSPLGLDKATSMTASSATNTRWAVLAYLVH
jgi:hypothetical protein